MKQSISVRILDIIASSGDRGMRLIEIQREVFRMTNPMWTGPLPKTVHSWWCTQLFGGGAFGHAGILNTFCTKNAEGRWVRNEIDHCGRPWKTMNAIRPSYGRRLKIGLMLQRSLQGPWCKSPAA